MKKKFSMVLATLMVVCTLAIALVACAPKDPDPFTAPAKVDAYNEIWNAWVKANSYQNGDTLGIDLKIDAKDTKDAKKTNLSIILQAGLDGKAGSNKEAIRLAVIDNIKKDDIIDVVINSEALYLDILGLEKPYKFEEINLPALGVGPNGANNQIETIKGYIIDAAMAIIGTDVTIDPVLADSKAKLYDVEYKFGLDFSAITGLLSDPAGLAGLLNMPELAGVLEQVLPMVSDLISDMKVEFTVKTTGNTQEKVEKPAKNAPKYTYGGGKVVGMSATGTKGKDSLSLAINGLQLINKLPNFSIPADSETVQGSVLKHQLTGDINLKNADGIVVSNYTYTINMEFTAENLISTIIECVNTGSATPILNKMFMEQQGKLFIEVNHTCGEVCQTNHVGGKKMDGSVIAIAFSPEDFDNNRIYVSLDLQTIFNDSFLSDVVGVSLNSLFPAYYTQFSFDFLEYMELVDMRANGVKPDSQATAGISAIADEQFSIGNMIGKIVSGLTADQELQIEIDDIRAIVDSLQSSLDEGTYWTILKAVNSLFQGVDKICLNGVYTNGANMEDMDILALYKRQNETTPKTFFDVDKPDENANHKIIKGDLTGWDKDDAGNVKIYQGATNDLNSTIYNANGTYTTFSYGELMELVVDQDTTNEKNTVVVQFNDIYGEAIVSRMNIIEIVGLDPTKFDEPQDVALVLSTGSAANKSAGIGSNINNLIGVLKGLSGLVKDLAILNELRTPELVIKTQITIAEVEQVEWSQAAVSGITETQIIDETKTYANGDEASDKCHIKVTFANGVVHEADVQANNSANTIKNNKVTSWSSFTLNFSAFGYTNEIKVNMDDELGIDNQTISLQMTGDSVTHTFSKSVKNNKINANMSLEEGETMAAIDAFATANGLSYEATSNFLGWTGAKITFKKEGTYKLTLRGTNGASINFTFIVITKFVNEPNLYSGMTKVYNGKIGDYSFTKKAIEDAVALNTNANMVCEVGGTDSAPTLSITFNATGKYTLTFVNTKGQYVVANFNIVEAAKTVDKLQLVNEQQVKLYEQFTDVKFEKEVIAVAVEAFNTTYTGKGSVTFNGDSENPILTFVLNETNGSGGYFMNMIGTNGEKAKLTIKATENEVNKAGLIGGDVVVVSSDEIGVAFDKTLADSVATSWNNNNTNKKKMTVEVVEEDGKISFKFTLLQAGVHQFKLTNKCIMNITSNYEYTATGVVGTELKLTKTDLNHNYYSFTTGVKDGEAEFNEIYAGKATVAIDSSVNVTFNFTEAGTYEFTMLQVKVTITVTTA